VATQAEDLTQGADDDLDPNADPNADDQQQDEPTPYDDLAKDLGWTPKDQYTGPPENWKTAEQFLRDGRDIQRETAREVKSLRTQLDTIAKTSGSIVEQQVRERIASLTDRHNELVEEGKAAEAFQVAEQITALKTGPAAARSGPSPAAQDFAQRNASWFNDQNPIAKTRAIEISNRLSAAGYDETTQLAEAEKRVRAEFPELFKDTRNGSKPQAGVNSPGSRAAPSKSGPKGFVDMPKAAQDVANDMVSRGVIKSKDDYAKNYWANAERKA
jgi:hypothetical protein